MKRSVFMSYLLLMGCIGCTTASGLCASFFNRKNAGYKIQRPFII